MNIANTKNIVHLRNYTQYSLSKGAIKINELVQYCVENKIPAVAISDFNNLFGCMEFSIECKKKGIQPIIGCNIFLKDKNFEPGYILLLCRNEKGFSNLSKLISVSTLENSKNTDSFITVENLKHYSSGLICLAGGQFGLITKNFYSSNNLSDSIIDMLSSIFGENFF